MTSGIAGNEFDDLFDRARQALDQVRSGAEPDPDAPEPEPVTAEAADGLARAVLSPAGTFVELKVDPKLLREGIDEVCAQLLIAVNAAIAELRARSRPAGAVDPDALAATLREVQTESVRRMAAFGTVVDDVVNRLIENGQRG
jgi:DNA-binding protein YbaB